jgi:hypothetical protein
MVEPASEGVRRTRRREVAAVAVLLLTQGALLAWSAWRHSPTTDELGHLSAGISYWETGSFDVYPVNPPLVRLIAAAPVWAAGAEIDWSHYPVPPNRAPAPLASAFSSANGARTFWLLTLARWACIPLVLTGGAVCYVWARTLYGPASGLLALTLWCFSPWVLGHGSLVTSDVPSAAMGILAVYGFWRWLERPRWAEAYTAGLTLGLALSTKTTWLLLIPLYAVFWLVSPSGGNRLASSEGRRFRPKSQFLAIQTVGLLLVNMAYAFDGTGKPLGDFRFVSGFFGGDRDGARFGNRFADSSLGRIPIPIPEHYLLGIDRQKSHFELSRRPSYFRGEFQERGWWYYYVYGLAVKSTLGTLALGVAAVVASCCYRAYRSRFQNEALVIAPALAVLLLVSSHTGFSHHVRYAMPALPFAFVWISKVGKVFEGRDRPLKWGACFAVFGAVASSLSVYPHSLSYFNELAGGPRGGVFHLSNSNIDWGQDLLYLKRWLDENRAGQPLYLAYYGPVDPHVAGIAYRLPPEGSVEMPDLEPGWYAVSVNHIQGYPFPLPDGTGNWQSRPRYAYAYFRRFEPVGSAGYSIYIYHLTPERIAAIRNRP